MSGLLLYIDASLAEGMQDIGIHDDLIVNNDVAL